MKASVLDLRKHMSKVLAALDNNEVVSLTYRGKEKAKIVPMSGPRGSDLMENAAFGLWAGRDGTEDVADTVRRIRKGRVNAL